MRSRVLVTAILALALLGLPSASATPSRVAGDVNGDGYAELILGNVRGTVEGKQFAGVVNVLHGSRAGVTRRDARWHRDRAGVAGVAVGVREGQRCCRGEFGKNVVTGDFNGDGFADVAATASGNLAKAGYPEQSQGINVLYGSPEGLTAAGDQLWTLARVGVEERGGISSLTAGDFDGDGADELAFYAAARNASHDVVLDAVYVLKGTKDGLRWRGGAELDRRSAGNDFRYTDRPELVVGDFDADGRDDLGLPMRVDDRNRLWVVSGGDDLLAMSRAESFEIESNRPALAAGDFDHDGYADVAVGAEYFRPAGYIAGPIGRVTVLRGSSEGVTDDGSYGIGPFPASEPVNEDSPPRFGAALAGGDANGDGFADLAVYARFDGPSRSNAVHVVLGSGEGLTPDGRRRITREDHGEWGSIGRKLHFADHDGDGRDDLTMIGSGVAVVVEGAAGGVDVRTAKVWRPNLPGIKGDGSFNEVATAAP